MPQSLIEQLQIGAVDGSSPITDLLRKAKLAAVKLKSDEFTAWIDLEFNGYEDSTTVPDYRIVAGALKFHNPYRGWQPIFGMGISTEKSCSRSVSYSPFRNRRVAR